MSIFNFQNGLYLLLGYEMVVDGWLTNVLVRHGLASEGNPFLESFAGSLNLILVKIIGVVAAILILRRITKKHPHLGLYSTLVFVLIYSAIVAWNSLILVGLVETL